MYVRSSFSIANSFTFQFDGLILKKILHQVEYHDILWDIGYAKTWEEASEELTNLYQERPPLEDFLAWRDLRVMDEIHWYG